MNDDSYGFTIIYHDDIPLWLMSYGGSYHPNAIPMLKQVLLRAYMAGKFFGGRGPEQSIPVRGGQWIYYNTAYNDRNRQTFSKFHGEEEIYYASNGIDERDLAGWHQFQGGLITHLPYRVGL
jgi:hypothetical protein